jgi:hypothetical protein
MAEKAVSVWNHAFTASWSALMRMCAELRYIKLSEWTWKTQLNMEHMKDLLPGDF